MQLSIPCIYFYIFTMLIRHGIIADSKKIKNLFLETIKEICKSDYNEEQINVCTTHVESNARWEKVLKEQFVLIAVDEDKITGFATLNHGNYMDLFYVHKDHQRQGIALNLYRQIEKEAIRQGQTEITGNVSITARPFFERMAFEVLKQQSVAIQDIPLTNFKMSKKLTPDTI